MNKAQLHELIEAKQPNICQVAAYRDGKLVYSDEWNGYKDTDCTHIMSATKSIVALLVGIAVDRGEIGSIDDKVLSYFPDYQVKRGEKTIYDVTIRHLLTMRAPYKATGMTTVEYANEYLFKPLGIAEHENYYAKSAEEHKQFTMDKEPKTNVWFADRDGLGTPGYGLCMCAKDMAKIGQLCLNEGVWEGKQIISASWIKDMTRPRKIEGQMWRGMMYGYLWWITNPEKNIYAAIGNSGNVIYVNPDKNVVVSVASYFKPTIFDRVDFIEEYVLKSLLDG